MYDRGAVAPVADTSPLDSVALSRVGAALGDATRCAIVVRLAEGPAYPAELAAGLGTTRANVSNHLASLRSWGLVVGTPEGRRVRYRLANPGFVDALRILLSTTGTAAR